MWLYEKTSYPSPQNSTIVVSRLFGRWRIDVGIRQQTGSILNALWRDALRRYAHRTSLNPRVLIIGFGGGGMVQDINRLFPHCQITAIEYDPSMIEIARRIKQWGHYPEPTIHLGDAQEVIVSMDEQFDLILIDIFKNNKPSNALYEGSFANAIAKRLAPNGIVVANVCTEPAGLARLEKVFSHTERWRRGINHFGAFWQ